MTDAPPAPLPVGRPRPTPGAPAGGASGGDLEAAGGGRDGAQRPGRPSAARLGFAGLTVIALAVFSLYAAYLASRVEDVTEAVPIVVPRDGAAATGVNQPAPDFTLTDVDGRPVSLADFAGRPVWINIWASWCAPCRAEMPDIAAVYDEVKAAEAQRGTTNGLAVLLVSIGEDPAVVRRYVSTTRNTLPVLVDPAFAITEHYRITGLPTHFFIGRDGAIREIAIGGLKPNGMRSRLAKITGEPG